MQHSEGENISLDFLDLAFLADHNNPLFRVSFFISNKEKNNSLSFALTEVTVTTLLNFVLYKDFLFKLSMTLSLDITELSCLLAVVILEFLSLLYATPGLKDP